jgi:outer membrane lipoprotein LolB
VVTGGESVRREGRLSVSAVDQRRGAAIFARRAFALVFVLPLLLLGCGTFPNIARQDVEKPANAFTLEARFSVRTPTDSATGNVQWQHTKESDTLSFTTPLGNEVARLVRKGSRYSLTDQQQRETEADSAEALLQQAVGVPLPVAQLTQWVSRAPENKAHYRLSSAGNAHEEGVSEVGWGVDFSYEAPRATPVRIRARHAGPPALDVRVVIDKFVAVP